MFPFECNDRTPLFEQYPIPVFEPYNGSASIVPSHPYFNPNAESPYPHASHRKPSSMTPNPKP